jgi:hypothetical protein
MPGGGVMKMQDFIRSYRWEIDEAINSVLYRHDGRGGRGTIPDPPPKRNDAERREWILNDEGLYRWARSEGVRI